MRHEVGVGDQHARRVLVGAEHADRLARLDKQRLVVVRASCRVAHDAVEILPRARGSADAAVDHQFMRVFGHVGVQVVHQHPHRRLGQPAFGGDLGAGGGEDVAQVVAGVHRASSGCGGRRRGFRTPGPPQDISERKKRQGQCRRGGKPAAGDQAGGGFEIGGKVAVLAQRRAPPARSADEDGVRGGRRSSGARGTRPPGRRISPRRRG